MKKTIALLFCAMPVLLLVAFYICRLGYNMRDAQISGMLMIFLGIVLSVVTPTICLLVMLFRGRPLQFGSGFVLSLLSGLAFWGVLYTDYGGEIHSFFAA
ncbi:hypothetical protein [Luteolibacter sp. AS25]|uniref:hypothetical protein n=1 Tax=Luteolibacter sp. AS25 TaxID=3135776 RepID=UPI00398B881C